MYIQHTAIFALAALLPAIHARAGVSLRQNGATCQTSDGSPKLLDITNVINELKGRGPDAICPQTNGKASKCTTLVVQDSAAISICGGTDAEGEGHKCMELANYATQIQTQCASKGLDKAGGRYDINASQKVEVINAGDTDD